MCVYDLHLQGLTLLRRWAELRSNEHSLCTENEKLPGDRLYLLTRGEDLVSLLADESALFRRWDNYRPVLIWGTGKSQAFNDLRLRDKNFVGSLVHLAEEHASIRQKKTLCLPVMASFRVMCRYNWLPSVYDDLRGIGLRVVSPPRTQAKYVCDTYYLGPSSTPENLLAAVPGGWFVRLRSGGLAHIPFGPSTAGMVEIRQVPHEYAQINYVMDEREIVITRYFPELFPRIVRFTDDNGLACLYVQRGETSP